MSMIDSLLARLARRTSSGRYIPEIDGLRFVAIALVVIFHLSIFVGAGSPVAFSTLPLATPFGAFAVAGHYGVELFFIISGFVLGLPFAMYSLAGGAPVQLRSYFVRRLTRLEPPYVIAMIGCAMALLAIGRITMGEALPHLGVGFLYLHNIVYGVSNRINTVAWTLEVEVQFYCFMPLLARIFEIPGTIVRRVAIVAIAMGTMLAQHFLIVRFPVLQLTLLNYLQFFLMGLLLADVYVMHWRTAGIGGWWWDVISLTGWPAFARFSMSHPYPTWQLPFLALVLCAAALRGPVSRRVFGNRWVTTIGGMCYSIYLLHYPLISFIGKTTRSIGVTASFQQYALVQGLLILPPLLVICAIFFVLIERPCMNSSWPHDLVHRLRGSPRRGPKPSDALA